MNAAMIPLSTGCTKPLSCGTRRVWVIYPRYSQVDVWNPGETKPRARLGAGDILTGEDVVPGFTHPVATFFM